VALLLLMNITDFGNHGQRKDIFDPFVTGQGLHLCMANL
jgi:hypothetical protein